MKISRNWLQSFFIDPLPSAQVVEEAFTFHVFEIDGIETKAGDDILDVKITPNRGHDCLCHYGIAKELSAILQLPISAAATDFSEIPAQSLLRRQAPQSDFAPTSPVSVALRTDLCTRYIAAYITGVKVGPSPQWLHERLESIGQRSINNVVDATNYVMFHLGQPLHAFDAGKLLQKDGKYALSVRAARSAEKLLTLDEKEYALQESMLVIADENADVAIGIAGIKGGMPASITEDATNIILESANFNGASVRKTAQTLKLRTDASQRFEQIISPELAMRGMDMVITLILKLAGGSLEEVTDIYPSPQEPSQVSVTKSEVQQVLGTTFTDVDIAASFNRLLFQYKKKEDTYIVDVPFERLDITLPEDLIEEIGRIQGYDKVPTIELPQLARTPEINKNFYWAEKVRDYLLKQGFSEVFTSVFAYKGERVVLNKVDGTKPYLRTNLKDGLQEALDKNIRNKELLGVTQVKLFEIGTVWKNGTEEIIYDLAVEKVKKQKTDEDYKREVELYLQTLPENPAEYGDLALSKAVRYAPYSKYPYIVRDVAVWVPESSSEKEIEMFILDEAGTLCVKISLFDRFGKDGRASLAYRLIFQSFEKTLTEAEVQTQMEKVYARLSKEGFEIR